MLCFKPFSTEMLFCTEATDTVFGHVKIPEGLEEVLRLLRLI